jgi:pimeloyl-ACP methyl ester carboxylesterase
MSDVECKVSNDTRSSDEPDRSSTLSIGAQRAYTYPGPARDYEARPLGKRFGCELTVVTFKSVLPSGIERNDAVTARLFETDSCDWTRPVVLLHGLAFSRLSMWDSFAAALARRGCPVLLVGMPFVCERTPPGDRLGAAYMRVAKPALPAYEQAVADVRAALEWLLTKHAARGGETSTVCWPALVGISMGALVGVIAAALEPRFERFVCLLGGADLDTLVFGGTYGPRIRRRIARAGISPARRKAATKAYAQYMKEVRRAAHPLDVPPPLRYFLLDPLTFAGLLRERPVLQLNALFDPIVSRRAARKLWREMGRPETCWLWGTHWVGGPWRPFVTWRIAEFLRRKG